MALCWRSFTRSWRRSAGSWRTRGESAGFLSRSMARACSWTRARSSIARWRRCHSVRQSREKAAPSAHMTHVVARHTGPMICIARTPLDVEGLPPANPTAVRTTPTTRNATDRTNMQRPAVSKVDQRFDIWDSIDAPTRPSLSTVEMEDRDTSVSWAAADDDGWLSEDDLTLLPSQWTTSQKQINTFYLPEKEGKNWYCAVWSWTEFL